MDAIEILREFVTDIEAVYGQIMDELTEEWPDLAVTYRKAKKFLQSLEIV